MKIKIAEIKDKKTWENFVLSRPNNSFFQSWAWGEVQKALGNKVWRLGVFDSNNLMGVCQVVKVTARRGIFLHLRHGPIFTKWQAGYFNPLLTHIKKIAKSEKVWFLRVSSQIERNIRNQEFFKTRGFQPAPIPGQDAEVAWVLDISLSEEELLSKMRKTTRYLIRRAQKMGITIVERRESQGLAAFLRLYRETAKRQHFVPHKEIREECEIFGKENAFLKLFLAEYQKKILAGALIVFYGKQAIYHHSGSSTKFSNIPVSYLLLWEAIREAKRQGKKVFNFWGIAPEDKPRHPWQGLTMFKKGFGGEVREYIHAFDLPISPFYSLTFLIETARQIWRGY